MDLLWLQKNENVIYQLFKKEEKMKKLWLHLVSLILFAGTIIIKAQSIPIVQITSGSNHKSETSIDVDPNNNNNVFVGSNVRIGSGPTKIGYFYSSNGGNNWTGNENFDDEHRVDPSVAYDLSGNLFYCFLKPDPNGALDEIHIKNHPTMVLIGFLILNYPIIIQINVT